MKKQSFLFALIVASAMSIVSCSKKGNTPSESLLEKDPSVHESFGLKINFSAYGGYQSGEVKHGGRPVNFLFQREPIF